MKSEESDKPENTELRRFPRYRRSLLVRFMGNPPYAGRTLDISALGMRVATLRRCEVGEPVVLELYLSDNDPFPIRLRGECRWSDVSDNNDNVVGIDLGRSHSRSLNVIMEYLEQAEEQ